MYQTSATEHYFQGTSRHQIPWHVIDWLSKV